MGRNTRYGLTLLVGIGLIIFAYQAWEHARSLLPKHVDGVYFDKANIDLGIVPCERAATARFKLYNTTSDYIRADISGASCKCADAKLETNVISPHTSTILTTEISASTIQARREASVVIKWYSLTHAARPSYLTASIKATSAFPLDPTPQVVDEKFEVGDTATRKVQIRLARSFFPVSNEQLITAQCESPGVGTRLAKISANVWEVTLDFTPSRMPLGVAKSSLKIKVPVSTQSTPIEMTLPVSLQVNSNIVLDPSSIYFGLVSSEKTVSRSVVIRSTNNTPFKLDQMRCDNKSISLQCADLGTIAKSFTVTCQLSPTFQQKTGDAIAEFVVAHDAQQLMNVHVIWFTK